MEDRDEYMVTSESLTLWSSLQLYKLIDIIEKVALLSSMSHFGVEILVDYMYFFNKEEIAALDNDNSIETFFTSEIKWLCSFRDYTVLCIV